LSAEPPYGSVWRFLYNSKSDRAFIARMGFDCSTFHYLLQSFRRASGTTAFPHSDHKNTAGIPVALPTLRIYLNRGSLDADGVLGLVLHHLNSTMADYTLQQICGWTPAVGSRYRNFGMQLLLHCL
ncbi:hypothetical protein BZA77DRAFT_219220, partial [Pyronema omphalodes]